MKVSILPIAHIPKKQMAKWIVGIKELETRARDNGEMLSSVAEETIMEINYEFNKLYERKETT